MTKAGPLQKSINKIERKIDHYNRRIDIARINIASAHRQLALIDIWNNIDPTIKTNKWPYNQMIARLNHVVSVYQQLVKEQEDLLVLITTV